MKELYDMLDWGGDHPNNPKLIIVHAMGEFIDYNGTVYKARDWLQFDKVSAHRLVHPNGDVTVCRADKQHAWHAGGHWNTDSLGIEFLCEGVHTYDTFLKKIKTPYVSTEQLMAGVDEIKNWMAEYHITDMRRHSDIAPDRKFDPGDGFQWNALRHLVGLGAAA